MVASTKTAVDPSDQDTRNDTETDQRDQDPSVRCSTCGRTWELTYELDELMVGNRALEQFALDHHRHTGHYPDEVTPWIVSCRQCPSGDQYLEGRPARRFAETHARHTRHTVVIEEPADGPTRTITPEDVASAETTGSTE